MWWEHRQDGLRRWLRIGWDSQEPAGYLLHWKINYASNLSFQTLKCPSPSRGRKKRVLCLPSWPPNVETLEDTPSIWIRDTGQESQSNRECGRSQNESQLFRLLLPSWWQTLACRSQNFTMCFQQGIAFMFVSCAKSGLLLTGPRKNAFLLWKSSECSFNGKQALNLHLPIPLPAVINPAFFKCSMMESVDDPSCHWWSTSEFCSENFLYMSW